MGQKNSKQEQQPVLPQNRRRVRGGGRRRRRSSLLSTNSKSTSGQSQSRRARARAKAKTKTKTTIQGEEGHEAKEDEERDNSTHGNGNRKGSNLGSVGGSTKGSVRTKSSHKHAANSGSNSNNNKNKYTRRIIDPPVSKSMLFTFEANPQWPEQVSVKAEETVVVSEDCGDGWSKVSVHTENGDIRGVVPTSYLGKVIDRSKGHVMRQQVEQRLGVLKGMAQEKLKYLALTGGAAIVHGAQKLAFDVILPGFNYAVYLYQSNESTRSIISRSTRMLHYYVIQGILPYISDQELTQLSQEVTEDIDTVETERAKRGQKRRRIRSSSTTGTSTNKKGDSQLAHASGSSSTATTTRTKKKKKASATS